MVAARKSPPLFDASVVPENSQYDKGNNNIRLTINRKPIYCRTWFCIPLTQWPGYDPGVEIKAACFTISKPTKYTLTFFLGGGGVDAFSNLHRLLKA